MRYFLLLIALSSLMMSLHAQQGCRSVDYQRTAITKDPGLVTRLSEIENFTHNKLKAQTVAPTGLDGGGAGNTGSTSGSVLPAYITIPVVVHVVYHSAAENISDEQISSQIDVLNRDYGKLNTDTAAIPSYYRSLAADCGFRFALAAIDTNNQSTSGIVRTYTAVQGFSYNDDIKFAAKGGDNAWNRDQYLNIWVGALTDGTLGYSSVLGCAKEVDGVVVDYTAFGTTGTATAPFNLGKTATHEIGHWLNLIHIWGDANCGDDHVADTPPQQQATHGNPSGMIFSCGNTPYGNLYMDYMDFTDDAGMHLFTYGQKDRMRTLFAAGGFRTSLLNTAALVAGTSTQSPPPDGQSTASASLHLYPNPAVGSVNVIFNGEVRAADIEVYDLVGKKVMATTFTGTILTLNVAGLPSGLYFVKVVGQPTAYRLLKM